jgi:hypothetical protein
MAERLNNYLTGAVPLGRVFLHDMLVVGTMVNAATGLLALAALSLDHLSVYLEWVALLIFLSPLPLNVILSIAVWRSAGREPGRLSGLARLCTLIWFPLMLII